jgi:prevent-host-death family protein
MKTLNITEARTQLSKIVNDAARGKTTIIARNGRPVARIVPFDNRKPEKIKFGTLNGKIEIPEDFDAPTRTSSTCSKTRVRFSRVQRSSENPAQLLRKHQHQHRQRG